jgi:hypothetical protein
MSYAEINAGSVEFGTIFAGTEIPALTTKVTIASGEGKLAKGAVLGVVTDGGKCRLVNGGSSDGSQVAKFVLAEDVDATSADVVAVAWKTGIFRYDFLYVAEGDTVAAHAEELRAVGIHYRDEY